ncbi:GNAT family N-acetyltransferase [Paenibacillus soyae]|uniref:GNAT family N-acetyltransferase n=1 Tax=Paenibacillus soyae TaxID=2969249 RepID=A0A9X2MXN7_9BACL|nr:GNAT family N-acetyltransferase [Paenibacillus soyae]MCR2807813.1 GNAT family N-acetyltransferase [Paenibacillus soyae]
MEVELKRLSRSNGEEEYRMVQEMEPGENGFVNGLYANDRSGFDAKIIKYVEMSDERNVPPHLVPQTTYWLYMDGLPVGYGKLRHCLNDNLRRHGGHIGYAIRPTCRGRGFGKILLGELLKEAFALEIREALLTCDETNAASRKIIESHNGVLAGIREGTCAYWVQTKA